MQLVKRIIHHLRANPVFYFLVDGNLRSPASISPIDLLTEKPDMFYNPDFINPANSKVTFEIIAEAPDFESFSTLHPELFI